MARGMDVDGVGLVVNYDCPAFARTYVHRVGRTARGGREGAAVTLCRAEEVRHFRATLRKIEGANAAQLTLQREAIAGAKKKYAAALLALRDVLNDERQNASSQGQGQAATQPLGKARLAALRARWAALDAPTARVTTEQIEAAANHQATAVVVAGGAGVGSDDEDDEESDEVNEADDEDDDDDDDEVDQDEEEEEDEDEEDIDALSASLLTTTDAADEVEEEEDDDDTSGSDDSDD